MGLAPTSQGPVRLDVKSRTDLALLRDRWDGLVSPLLVTVRYWNAKKEPKDLSLAQYQTLKREVATFIDAVQQRKAALDAQIKAPGADLSKIDVNSGWPAPGTL
jgi:hypothetical protein